MKGKIDIIMGKKLILALKMLNKLRKIGKIGFPLMILALRNRKFRSGANHIEFPQPLWGMPR